MSTVNKERRKVLFDIIGPRIRQLREAHSMRQSQIADYCNVAHCSISNVETGRSLPTLGLLERIAMSLGVGIRELLENSPPVVLADDPFCMEIAALLPALTATHREDILRVLRDLPCAVDGRKFPRHRRS